MMTDKYHKWLLPIGWLYGVVVRLRNRLYDTHIIRSEKFDIPVISIGNLTVGGTGKTPHTEYLIKLLSNHYNVAVLSRGYGRRTRGYILANNDSRQTSIGDEPYQILHKFPGITVAVDESRADGIRRLQNSVKPDVIILDDAFQHRSVIPSLNILVINYHRDIFSDYMLPAGLLREPAQGFRRANVIVISKCPSDITSRQMNDISARFGKKFAGRIFFSGLSYSTMRPLIKEKDKGTMSLSEIKTDTPVLIVSGIASPQLMVEKIHEYTDKISILSFHDHHQFSNVDIARIQQAYSTFNNNNGIIITTEKDAARLEAMLLTPNLADKFFVLPTEVFFIKDGDIFNDLIIHNINNVK